MQSEQQTEQVCENLRTALAAAGGSLDDIVRVDVYVTDIREFDKIHAVRRRYFPADPPASTMVQVTTCSRSSACSLQTPRSSACLVGAKQITDGSV